MLGRTRLCSNKQFVLVELNCQQGLEGILGQRKPKGGHGGAPWGRTPRL